MIGSNIDEFKAWYSMSTKTFTSTDPLFTEEYISKNEIVAQTYTASNGKLMYRINEVNEKGERHGVCLTIIPFVQI